MDGDRPIMRRPSIRNVGGLALLTVPSLFLGYFFLYPLLTISRRGLTVDGSLDLSVFGDVLTDPSLQGVAAFTLWQAIASTILTVAFGFPAAWVFARFTFRGKRILGALTLVPFVLPTLVVATAFLNLVGPRGVTGVDLTGTLTIILMAHVFYNFSVVVRGVGSYWARIDPSLEDAARTLGASAWSAFRSITFPLLRPAIAATSALVFLFSFTSFGVVLVLGDLSRTTIEVEIWRQATAFLRLDVASTLAILQIIGIGAVLVVYSAIERRTKTSFTQDMGAGRAPRTRGERIAVRTILMITMAFLGIPLGMLVARSLQAPGGGFGWDNYASLVELPASSAGFIAPTEAIANSLGFAVAATMIAMGIGVLAAGAMTFTRPKVGRTLDLFVMLPLGTSAVTIGFGFLVAVGQPIDIRGSAVLIPIAHALVGIPFVVRTVNPALGSIGASIREAAATLGAGPFRIFWSVDLRIVRSALLVGAAFAFAISMGEFGATSFISRPSTPTIPVAIYRYLGRPGDAPFGAALAMSVILMAVTAGAIVAIEAFGSSRRRRS